MDPESTNTAELLVPQAPKQWKLRLFSAGTERCRVLRVGDCVSLGSGDEATVTINDPAVSALHCTVQATDHGLTLTDVGSKNGVFLGEGRVQSAVLSGPQASFSIGYTTVLVEPRLPREQPSDDWGLVGSSEPMRRLRQSIARFALLRGPVLITGESGTGKDVVARVLHQLSRRSGAYVPLNVAALSDNLIDAELFGHVRGAFTGADNHRAGAFVQADKGTLFLDEIADLALVGQCKLLRVVEDRMVRPVGGSQCQEVDVRVISATCIPLDRRIEEERFRPDLYHRLSTLELQVPPLRQRRSDIPTLARTLLDRMAGELGQRRLHPAALDALGQYSWPGNVRQLHQVLYRAAAQFSGEVIEPGHLEIGRDLSRRKRTLDLAYAKELLGSHPTVSSAARAAGVPRTTFRSVLERGARSE